MNDKIIKTALAYDLGADLHHQWCQQELQAFLERMLIAFENNNHNFINATETACFKGEDKRNEVEFDCDYHSFNTGDILHVFTVIAGKKFLLISTKNFNEFESLNEKGLFCKVKRFTKRKLTEEEIERMGDDYQNGKENILRPFSQLSAASQKDNLEAAVAVIQLVYDKVIAGKRITKKELEQMAAIVHEEWLKRNSWVFDPNYGKPELAVPYTELSPEEQKKDLAQITQAIKKVQAYVNGQINIDDICEQYNIEDGVMKKKSF